ncbi:uncharacterized protein LOC133186688 [Saccostrea echinata]|uniref:uncharacterized protein LOC133186688 n=1 Tax=Saccostrea echinata TaxID=191078 RepID=UPI002A803013|nr:uncharacterized protein LOC133186688 [Saccostrea echinata]
MINKNSCNGETKRNISLSHLDAGQICENDSNDFDAKKKHSTGSQTGDSGIGSFRRTTSNSSSLTDVNTSLQKQAKCNRRKVSAGDVMDNIHTFQNRNGVGKLKIRKLSAESFFEGYCQNRKAPETEDIRCRKYSFENFFRGLLGNKIKVSKSQSNNLLQTHSEKSEANETKEFSASNNCSVLEQCHENLAFESNENDLHKHDEAAVQEILNELHEMASDPKNLTSDVSRAEKLTLPLKNGFPRHRVLAKSDSGYGTTENLSITSATTFL